MSKVATMATSRWSLCERPLNGVSANLQPFAQYLTAPLNQLWR